MSVYQTPIIMGLACAELGGHDRTLTIDTRDARLVRHPIRGACMKVTRALERHLKQSLQQRGFAELLPQCQRAKP